MPQARSARATSSGRARAVDDGGGGLWRPRLSACVKLSWAHANQFVSCDRQCLRVDWIQSAGWRTVVVASAAKFVPTAPSKSPKWWWPGLCALGDAKRRRPQAPPPPSRATRSQRPWATQSEDDSPARCLSRCTSVLDPDDGTRSCQSFTVR